LDGCWFFFFFFFFVLLLFFVFFFLFFVFFFLFFVFERGLGFAGEWAVARGVDGVAGGDGAGDSTDGGGV
jgi:hypothetical protein